MRQRQDPSQAASSAWWRKRGSRRADMPTTWPSPSSTGLEKIDTSGALHMRAWRRSRIRHVSVHAAGPRIGRRGIGATHVMRRRRARSGPPTRRPRARRIARSIGGGGRRIRRSIERRSSASGMGSARRRSNACSSTRMDVAASAEPRNLTASTTVIEPATSERFSAAAATLAWASFATSQS